jgi:DNA-binding NarL/FixJ family response regulator
MAMPEIAPKTAAGGSDIQSDFEAGGHVCLAGAGVTNNWSLIEPLKRNNQVTVVERLRMLHANSILATANVLVLDCGESPEWGLGAVRGLRRVYPDVDIVLVNGGLSAPEIAEAFREGVRDYFSHQSNTELVVERVQNLCRQARRGEAGAREWGGGAPS